MADSRTVIQARYDSKNRKSFAIKLNYNYDQDIIDKLETVESVNGYIKQLIRDDITRTRTDSSRTALFPDNANGITTLSDEMYKSTARTDSVPKTEVDK